MKCIMCDKETGSDKKKTCGSKCRKAMSRQSVTDSVTNVTVVAECDKPFKLKGVTVKREIVANEQPLSPQHGVLANGAGSGNVDYSHKPETSGQDLTVTDGITHFPDDPINTDIEIVLGGEVVMDVKKLSRQQLYSAIAAYPHDQWVGSAEHKELMRRLRAWDVEKLEELGYHVPVWKVVA